MAEIYRAKTFDSQGHAHLVAVKRVLAHLAEDDDFIQMLVDEAKIASVLRHHNIARVYEFARAHGEYFIAMEHVDGKDTRTILERCRQKKKPMPAEHAAYVAAEVAAALHAAHTAADAKRRPLRIVHRDVSPSNIIASYTGEVKLCDFGIAKATLSRVNTKTGVIKGKVKYMSPEQALGRKLDHRSDIFSLGSCLYEMLTRVPPFTASNEMDLLIKVRDAKYRPVSDLVPSVPPELEGITDKCLTRSRAHRYQTAAEVEADLRAFLKRYVPTYSRSHLGRYVRKMFATEIERELRMLEEFVIADEVSDDVGENLIPQSEGAPAPDVPFHPKPTSTVLPQAPPGGDFADGSSQTTLPTGRHGEAATGEDTRPPRGGADSDFDVHGADTQIIDDTRHRLAGRGSMRAPAADTSTGTRPDAGAAARADRAARAVTSGDDAAHFARRRIGDELQCRRPEAHLDAAPDHVVVHDLEELGPVRRAVCPRIVLARVELGHVRDRGMVEGLGAGQRVVAADAALVRVVGELALLVLLDRGDDSGAVHAREVAHVMLELAHAVGEGENHVVGRTPAVGRLEIGEGAGAVAGAAHGAVGADRQPPGHLVLLDQQHRGAAVRGGDGGDAAAVAEADDDDVVDLVELSGPLSHGAGTSAPPRAAPRTR